MDLFGVRHRTTDIEGRLERRRSERNPSEIIVNESDIPEVTEASHYLIANAHHHAPPREEYRRDLAFRIVHCLERIPPICRQPGRPRAVYSPYEAAEVGVLSYLCGQSLLVVGEVNRGIYHLREAAWCFLQADMYDEIASCLNWISIGLHQISMNAEAVTVASLGISLINQGWATDLNIQHGLYRDRAKAQMGAQRVDLARRDFGEALAVECPTAVSAEIVAIIDAHGCEMDMIETKGSQTRLAELRTVIGKLECDREALVKARHGFWLVRSKIVLAEAFRKFDGRESVRYLSELTEAKNVAEECNYLRIKGRIHHLENRGWYLCPP
jgi:hypothetical protein